MIYHGIDYNFYEQLPGVRCSTLKPYLESTKAGKVAESKVWNSTALDVGILTHAYVLEGVDKYKQLLDSDYIFDAPVNPSTGQVYGSGTKKVQDWLADNPGKKFLDPALIKQVEDMAEAVHTHDKAMSILEQCNWRECAITWTDKSTGVECKALIDFYGDKIAGDLKTTASGWHINGLERAMYDYAYHMQFAFYSDGLRANGIDINEFYVIFVQKSDAPDVCVGCVNYTAIEQGQVDYIKALNNWQAGQEIEQASKCPGKFPDIIDIGIPYYAVEEFQEASTLNLDWSM